MTLVVDNITSEGFLSATTVSAATVFLGTSNINTLFVPLTNGSVTGQTNFASLSATTISGGTLYSATTDLNTFFNQDRAQINTKANLSGATFTGTVAAPSLSVTTISGGTLYSGSTDLDAVIRSVSTRVQPGSNITTGGTLNLPTINVVSSPSFNSLSFSGTAIGSALSATTISGGTLFSGNTNLDTVIRSVSTRVQPGSNITTGGTLNLPTINVVSSPSFNSLSFSGTASGSSFSANTISGGTLYSGSTNLSNLFLTLASPLTGYVIAASGTTSALTSSNTILQGFQNLERLIKNIDFQSATATTTTTTTSSSFVDLAGMSAQTKNLGQTGLYFIMFNSSCQNTNNGRLISAQIVVDGNALTQSIVSINAAVSNAGRREPITLMAVASIPSGKVVKVQWFTNANTASMFGRTLTIIGIPNNYIL